MDIERQPFDLRECVESALDLIGRRAAEKHLDLAYVFESEVPAAINGDVTRLRQVLLNLLTNAVKFTRRGRGRADVNAEGARADGAAELSFAVRDTGIGLTSEGLAQAVPELQPGRQQHHAQVRRHRAGAGHQQAPGRADGRQRCGPKATGRARARPSASACLRAHAESAPRPAARLQRHSSRHWPASACWWWTTTPPTGASWRCRRPSGA